MPLDELLQLDLDTIRFVVVASVAVGILVYLKLRISEAGTLTGGYIAILAISGQFGVIAITFVAAAVALLVTKVVLTRWFGLTRQWVFVIGVLAGAAAMTGFQLLLSQTGTIDLPWGLSLILYAGSFIIPGLIAYDLARQGLRVTALGLSLVILGTLALVIPVLALADWLQPESTTPYISTTGRVPEDLFWLGTLATILFSGALRLSFALRTGGFIAPLFIVEVLSIEALVTIFLAALAAHLIATWLRPRVVWSPRLRFQFTVMFGAMAAWTGLYWGARLGWEPALEANSYALEPLLAVALVASDMGRGDSGVVRTLLGTTAGVLFVAAVIGLATLGTAAATAACVALLLVLPVVLFIPGIQGLRNSWKNAVAVGREVADEAPGSAEALPLAKG